MINPLTSGGSRCLVGGLEHFLFVHSVGNNDLNWLIFFRGVETTNQINNCNNNIVFKPIYNLQLITLGQLSSLLLAIEKHMLVGLVGQL